MYATIDTIDTTDWPEAQPGQPWGPLEERLGREAIALDLAKEVGVVRIEPPVYYRLPRGKTHVCVYVHVRPPDHFRHEAHANVWDGCNGMAMGRALVAEPPKPGQGCKWCTYERGRSAREVRAAAEPEEIDDGS